MSNHQAFIAAITAVKEIPNADKIQIAYVLGESVIVGKEAKVGDVGLFFPPEVQLSEAFCYNNNLFRDKTKNKDNTKQGFFDENRKVRVQKFMGEKSEGYFTNVESLHYITDVFNFSINESFSELNGQEICRKWISPETEKLKASINKQKSNKKSESPDFLKHVDSKQLKYALNEIKPGNRVYVHAKVHGTSFRVGKHLEANQGPKPLEIPFWKRWVNKIFNEPLFPEVVYHIPAYELVVGTRNVVLKSEDKEGFHGSEKFRFDVAKELEPYLEKGMTIYGEIAGYANGKPIMATHDSSVLKDKAFTEKYGKDIVYKYGCKENEYRFHIYRITQLAVNGEHIDYTQEQLENWCKKRGFLYPYEVVSFTVTNEFEVDKIAEYWAENVANLTEDYIDSSHPSEGVILRVEDGSLQPRFYKCKSYAFRVMEGICKAADTEDAA